MKANAMIKCAFLLFLLFAPAAYANGCLAIEDDAVRLRCYDDKARPESAALPEGGAAGEPAAMIGARELKLCVVLEQGMARLSCYRRQPGAPDTQCGLKEDPNAALSCFDAVAGRRTDTAVCIAIERGDERLECYRRQPNASENPCDRKRDLDVMLYCFDQAAARSSPDDRFVLLPLPSRSRIMLKSDAKPITIMGEIDAKPAELSVARRDGDHFVDAKAALVWQRSMSQEWSWFGGGAWTRTDKASGRKDVRGLETGLQWTRQGDSVKEGWWHVVTGSVSYENNIADDAEATGLGLLWEFGNHAWMGERWTFAPALGLRTERGDEAGSDYDFSTVYVVGAGRWKPNDMVELFLTGGYLDDFDASTGVTERDGDFGSVGIKYFLYDKAEKPTFRPELRLVRYFGVNPLDPDAPVNETRLTLGVLFDSLRSAK